MKKTKIPRKKVRGKNMKRLFACLLSLSMIPANGVAVFAAQEQVKAASTQSTEVKTQSGNEETSNVKFAQDSLVSKIGCFKYYRFEGINQDDIKDVKFTSSNTDVMDIYHYKAVINDDNINGYYIYPKKIGTTEITAHIIKTDGTEMTLAKTKLTVEANDEDIVPITSRFLFDAIRNTLNLPYESTCITKEQIRKLKKLDARYSGDDLNGLEYATNCEEIDFSNRYNLNDISKVAQLTKLKKINLSNTSVREISALKGLKNLTYVNLNNTQVSTEDRFSLFKTDDVSIEAGTEVTDLLNPKGLVQTADTITSSDSSIVKAEQEKKSDGTREWVFKALEGAEGKEAVLTIQNGTQKKEIKVKVTAKGNTVPDFAEKSVETNIGCFKKIALKNVDETNVTITYSDSTILNISQQKQYYGSGQQYHITYRFEPKSEGTVTLTGYFEQEDGTKYKATMNVTVNKEKSNIVPIKKYDILRQLVNYDELEYELTWDELNNKKELYLSGGYIESEDMDWISKAKNCKRLTLAYNYQLSNASKLKEMKDQLEYLDINNTGISDSDRVDLMKDNAISVPEGSSTEKTILPNGLLKSDDIVEIEDSSIAEVEVKENDNYPSYNYAVIKAKKGQAGKSTVLKITSSEGSTKEIAVNITKKTENAPGFANEKMETSIGKFSEIELKNMDNAKVEVDPESDNEDVVTIKSEENYDYDLDESVVHYYLVPKSTGTATITVQCKLDGTTYEDTMEVTVGTDDQIVPIKDYGLYKAINSSLSNDVQSDHILKSTMASLKTITAKNRGITDISGIEYATECKKINLSRNKKLTDISNLKELTKLQNVNLSTTAVKDISALQGVKDQLVSLYLSGSKVSAADRLSFVKENQSMEVEAGTEKEIEVKPYGILGSQDKFAIEGDSKVEVSNSGNGIVTLGARDAEEGKATLVITNDQAANTTVKIPIEVTAKREDIPGFAKESEDITIGDLQKIKFVNNNEEDVTIDAKSENTSIVDIDGPYSDELHFIPKSEGTTTVKATFKTDSGTIYTDSMTVTVKEADSTQKIVPIKSWETFNRLTQDNDIKLEDGVYRLTEDQMKGIKKVSLESYDAKISKDDMSGLDQAVNCEEFMAGYNGFDYTQIRSLVEGYTKLKSLSLQGVYINQDEFNELLASNKNLEELQIYFYTDEDDQVEDFSKLKELTNLKVLELNSSGLKDISDITSLSKLEELSLQYTQIKNLEGIEKLTNLKKLDLNDASYIDDFDVISNLKNLETLNLCQTKIKDITPLKKLEKLKNINLNDTRVSAKDRLSLIRTNLIELEEGETSRLNLSPSGLIEDYYGDRVELEKENQGIELDYDYAYKLKANSGSAGAETNLLIKNNGEVCAKIPIKVVSEKAENPGFKEKSETILIGQFKPIEVKNAKDIEVWFDTEDEEIVDVDHDYNEQDGDVYYFVPKKAGETTIIGHFRKEDSNDYTKKLKVTVKDVAENILPISNRDIYLALLDSKGNSVDANKDHMIDTNEIKNVSTIKGHYCSIEDKDFDYLKKAVNCEKMDISDNKALTDLSFISSFPKLKEINLENDEKITDFKDLITHKEQFDSIILPAQAPDTVRKDLINIEKISLKEGKTVTDAVQPSGLLKDTDKVSVKDSNIAEAKIVPQYDEDEDVIGVKLEVTGKSAGTTTLTLEMGSETKEIAVTVKKNTDAKIEFADASKNVKTAQFKSYNFKNVDAPDIKQVKFTYDKDNILKMVSNSDHSYTPVALKDHGTVKVSAEITLKNGLKETVGEQEFTVVPADESAVIIKDYDLYKGMKSNGASADADKDGIISKNEIKNVDDIEVINSSIEDLTGVEQAVNCKKADFSNDAMLKDIMPLAKLTNLTSVNLRDTSVSNITALKGLTKLDFVCLDDSNVNENDKIDLLRLENISLTEGESTTQEIKPNGLLGKDVDVIVGSNIATAKIGEGKLVVTGKSAGQTTLEIGNKDQKARKKITISVTAKATEAPAEPTKPENPKPEAPKPTPTQPTTAAPQKVAKITVTAPSNKLSAGKKVKLTANISNNASNKNIKWTTSNKKYATVDKNGVVKFNKKAAGKTVTITAYATDGSGKKATFKIKIMKGTVKKIKITGKKTVKAGKTLSLKAKVTASKGANKKLKWTSSNTKYATVSGSGKVKALKAGKKKSVKITAMATDGSGKKASVTIKIK